MRPELSFAGGAWWFCGTKVLDIHAGSGRIWDAWRQSFPGLDPQAVTASWTP